MPRHLKENAKRIEEIVRVLTKYRLAHFIHASNSDTVKKLAAKFSGSEAMELSNIDTPQRIRRALAELGPTFIKLGQMLSTRADIVGSEIAGELEKLQSSAPADSMDWVRTLIETELGDTIPNLFADFAEEPMGSASIAQVHRAVLFDGTKVVVKIQHENIQQKVESDLAILLFLADLAEKSSEDLSLYQPRATLVQFRKNLLKELDFNSELQNLQQFQANFEDDPTVVIPAAYPDLSATRVLTMERIDGISVKEKARLKGKDFDPETLAKRCVEIYINMIFRDRFYHADPHPGNILVLKNNVIGLLDFGMVGYLDSVTREKFEGVIAGFVSRDLDRLIDSCIELGRAPVDLDRDQLLLDIDVFISESLSRPLKDMNIGKVLEEFTTIVRNHRIVQHPGIQLLIKVLIMLEGTGRLLDPTFNLSEVLEPVKQRAIERRFSLDSLWHSLKKSSYDWDTLLKSLPRDLSEIIRRFRQGTIEVNLKHHHLDATANRLAYGLITASIFLGSTQLISQRIPPLVSGTSIPGLIGMAFSAWMIFQLIMAIKSSGGLR